MTPILPETGEPTSIVGWITYLGLGLAALGLGLQKALRGWAADRMARLADDAVSSTIQMLRSENDRLRSHNAELVGVFQAAQTRIVTIAGENQRLQVELDQLRNDLARALSRLEGDH